MKSASNIILAAVLGSCALFGYGVSKAVDPVLDGASAPFSQSSAPEKSDAESVLDLRKELESKYEKVVFTDQQLSDLQCGADTDWLGNKDCYKGATNEAKKYGSANVIMDGKPTYVRLVSMPAGAFLNKQ